MSHVRATLCHMVTDREIEASITYLKEGTPRGCCSTVRCCRHGGAIAVLVPSRRRQPRRIGNSVMKRMLENMITQIFLDFGPGPTKRNTGRSGISTSNHTRRLDPVGLCHTLEKASFQSVDAKKTKWAMKYSAVDEAISTKCGQQTLTR